MVRKLPLILLGLMLLFVPQSLLANDTLSVLDSADTEMVLLLVKVKNSKVKYFRTGHKVKLGLRKGSKVVKGIMEEVSDSGLVVNTVFYTFDELSWIKARTQGAKTVKVGGAVLLGLGTISTISGAGLISVGVNSGDACCAIAGILGGVTLLASGTAFFIPGLVMVLAPPRYDLKEKWIIQKGEMVVEN